MVPKIDPIVDSFRNCFQKKRENKKVRFDYTGAYELHVSSHREAPEATQNSPEKTNRFQEPFFLRKIRTITNTDSRKVSKWVTLFRANVPWAPLCAQLVRQSVLEDVNRHKVFPQSSKLFQKVTPKDPKRSKSDFISAAFLGPGLADCAERFQ